MKDKDEKQSTCHVFGQTHCEKVMWRLWEEVLKGGKRDKKNHCNRSKKMTLVEQCRKKNSDLSRLWTDTLCERKNSLGNKKK